MSGQTELFNAVILVVSVVAAFTDLAWGKIYNLFNLVVLLSGFVFSIYFYGWNGLFQAILGVIAGFIFYGWMFYLKFMGGGDVKFLMALGAWGGLRYVEEVAILGILVGGVISFFILLLRGRIVNFAQRMYHFLLSVTVKELEKQPINLDMTLKMPFGVPISIAAIWTAFYHPLNKLGIVLWP